MLNFSEWSNIVRMTAGYSWYGSGTACRAGPYERAAHGWGYTCRQRWCLSFQAVLWLLNRYDLHVSVHTSCIRGGYRETVLHSSSRFNVELTCTLTGDLANCYFDSRSKTARKITTWKWQIRASRTAALASSSWRRWTTSSCPASPVCRPGSGPGSVWRAGRSSEAAYLHRARTGGRL